MLPNEQAHRLDGILNGLQKLSCTEKQQPDSYNDPNQNQRRKVKERREDIYQRQLHAFTDFYMALGEEHRTHQRDKKRRPERHPQYRSQHIQGEAVPIGEEALRVEGFARLLDGNIAHHLANFPGR